MSFLRIRFRLPFNMDDDVAWILILISGSILRSLMNLILLICAHHHRPQFNNVFCYSALHLLWEYDSLFSVQRVLYYPESLTDWSHGAMLLHACMPVCVCLCVCVCVCVHVCVCTHICVCPLFIHSLTIAHPSVSCGPLCWEESITFSLALPLRCVSTRAALWSTLSAQMLMHVAHMYWRLF